MRNKPRGATCSDDLVISGRLHRLSKDCPPAGLSAFPSPGRVQVSRSAKPFPADERSVRAGGTVTLRGTVIRSNWKITAYLIFGRCPPPGQRTGTVSPEPSPFLMMFFPVKRLDPGWSGSLPANRRSARAVGRLRSAELSSGQIGKSQLI